MFLESLAWQDVAVFVGENVSKPSVPVRELRIQAQKLQRMISRPQGNFTSAANASGFTLCKEDA